MKYRLDTVATRVARAARRLHRGIVIPAVCLCAAWAALVGSAEAEQYDTVSPEATIETLHDGLVEAAAEVRSADLDTRYQALRALIVATHDLPYIAEFTIRRQWAELTSEQRAAFIAAFERLSVMTYAVRFAELGADTLRISSAPADDASGRAQVTGLIARPLAEDIPLEYMLHEGEGGWRIINIVADGVSDLALKRAEFQRVLARGSIDDLVRYLEEQSARLASGG